MSDGGSMVTDHMYLRNAAKTERICCCGEHLRRHVFVSGWNTVTKKRGMPQPGGRRWPTMKQIKKMMEENPNMYPKVVDLSFPWSDELQGDSGVAIKDGQDQPWEIYLPWTHCLFYGTKPEMLVEVRKLIKKADVVVDAQDEVNP